MGGELLDVIVNLVLTRKGIRSEHLELYVVPDRHVEEQ